MNSLSTSYCHQYLFLPLIFNHSPFSLIFFYEYLIGHHKRSFADQNLAVIVSFNYDTLVIFSVVTVDENI